MDKVNNLKDLINDICDNLSWSEIIPVHKESGTTKCPFCNRISKAYLYPNYFKCFSSKCGVQGNKFNIYKQYNKLDFKEALKELKTRSNLDYQQQQSIFETRNNLLIKVQEAYINELNNNPKAFEWLIKRGFNKEFLSNYKIGYAPSNSVLKDYNINYNKLRQHKLCNSKGEFFQKRIIFPVYNTLGYLVHFTGRSYPAFSKDYKYLDTPQIPIIGSCKNYLLFEEWLSSYKNKEDKTLFLVEGVPDTYILSQCGASVVGLLGLHKVINQVKKFQGFNKIIAVFDNDRYETDHPYFPGEYKSWRVVLNQLINLQLALGKNIEVRTCILPENLYYSDNKVKDVNDLYLYLNKDNKETINYLKHNSKNLVEEYINKYKGDLSFHKTALKLIYATNKHKNLLEKYIAKDLSPVDYALKILS